jgi:arabinan endo-1,5-alpha-L-arabinosidase
MRWRLVLSVLLFAAAPALAVAPVPAPHQPVLEGDVYIHDPSLIEVNGTWIAFQTGQEGGLHRGAIRLKISSDGISWQNAGAIGRGTPGWIEQALTVRPRNIWAPAISEFGGRHYLYYSASLFGTNLSVIGLMTNDDLDPRSPGEGWIDQGMLLQTGPKDNFNAIDPFRADTEDGRAWLAFGSFWSGIKLRELDPNSGKLLESNPEQYDLADRGGAGIEAPSILRHGDHYYLFVSLDQCCRGAASTYRIAVGRAEEVTGPYHAKDGTPMLEGGFTEVLSSQGRYVGPGGQEAYHTPDGDILAFHYYDKEDLEKAKLQVSPLRWDADGWPYLDPWPSPEDLNAGN